MRRILQAQNVGVGQASRLSATGTRGSPSHQATIPWPPLDLFSDSCDALPRHKCHPRARGGNLLQAQDSFDAGASRHQRRVARPRERKPAKAPLKVEAERHALHGPLPLTVGQRISGCPFLRTAGKPAANRSHHHQLRRVAPVARAGRAHHIHTHEIPHARELVHH